MGTFTLVQVVTSRIKRPVIAAGGIASASGVRAALALGAQAAQVGTAFLACAQSGASALHRELLFSERARETTLTRAFTGRLARGLRNRWTDTFEQRQTELPPFPITSWFVGKLKAAALAQERSDLLALWCGQVAPNLTHRDAAALMASLVSG
jgi:nitronate monooxygenase